MAGQGWLSLFAAALGGGFTVKTVEIVYQEYRGWKARRVDDTRTIESSLEPLLRAADELVGKLRSLAEQDFIPIRDVERTTLEDVRYASVVYLFVQFWSEVEIVRFRGMSVAVARSARGKQLRAFLVCLESRKVRLIDRISQRALGEAALVGGRTMNFVEFVRACESDVYMQRWLAPLTAVFSRIHESDARQRVIQYGTVLHALIDTIDPKHLVSKERPATPNKLNAKSWKELNYRVFGLYLTFVKDRPKYIGPPKRRP
ncbi:hypothetical protein [Sphingomonas hengshuiensis]|uniref:Uncharacterized protein n=1 Tax=Sphingomonas hengshuiensis TaxID=1609977 RepID=A0A7U5BET2_9SPHN|nr:hypothetical protein [Sphingomonas hengshuiensis]AJP70957.1 hypothetical protein TS85_02640 [Sphingomonas hengshuiensis]